MVEAKLVVLGAQGCGKTSLVVRHTRRGSLPRGSLPKTMGSTVGASFVTSQIHIGDRRVTLQVWDTAGQERFRAMAPMYYRHANAALIVYDVTSRVSFDAAAGWVEEMKDRVGKNLVICVIGNKIDLDARRVISQEEGQDYAQSIGALFYETSALTSDGVHHVFMAVGAAILEQHAKAEQLRIEAIYAKKSASQECITLGDMSDSPTSHTVCCWS